ncbi:hypothetical protein JAAARDRAFT_175969 [Jaapia argillacea MUCL 33604]|uniref:IMD domain-containing protein n=1 Tax=Jaapia argillacea MUCL 33604 TaxID=933084 RepID=A0A067PWV4_9AGAM|nr:hypothetical protein JAAARDRAFT_175969 [Jaapia argillacea MUCL 33604]
MATSPSTAPIIADRSEIHKGCKALETLVNVLNDYCEAASAMVTLQKKLTKALRETAGLKCTAHIATNALNASATIFDALFEVDSKFAKLVDKECDAVSADVKKWFKKLAKEERAHDERIATANYRLKSAGQIYEKKSKRNLHDASEEHARYVNLINTLGPELSQEKYNHALLVTQRHTATTYSVAACLARIADAHWLRTCEVLRRASPAIGSVGEWRTLCEANWSRPVPKDLPDLGVQEQGPPELRSDWDQEDRTLSGSPWPPRHFDDSGTPTPDVGFETPEGLGTPSGHPVDQLTPPQSTGTPSSNPGKSTSEWGGGIQDGRDGSTRSMASLSSFPSPPTHFPLPLLSDRHLSASQSSPVASSLGRTSETQESQPPSHQPPADSHPGVEVLPPLTESPQEVLPDLPPTNGSDTIPPRPTSPPQPPRSTSDPVITDSPHRGDDGETSTVQQAVPAPLPEVHSKQDNEKAPSSSKSASLIGTHLRGDYLEDRKADIAGDREVGVDRNGVLEARTRSLDASKKQQGIERSESVTSSGSIVAAMRNRYRATGPSSPPPRDLPRLALSVSDLANRYTKPEETPTSPRQRAISPPADRTTSVTESDPRRTNERHRPDGRGSTSPHLRSTESDDLVRRRQRIEQLEELERRENELELRERERDLEHRARELERDRAHILTARGMKADGYKTDTSFSSSNRGPSSHSPQYEFPSPVVSQTRYSSSTTQLVPPPSNSGPSSQQRSRSRPTTPNTTAPSDHAPYCGCAACSVAKYKSPNPAPSPRDLRPPEPPITLRPEKPKGWIRRLSMPVGQAFSLDSKKNTSSTSLASTANSRHSVADEDGRLATRTFYKDPSGGIGNRSSATPGRR